MSERFVVGIDLFQLGLFGFVQLVQLVQLIQLRHRVQLFGSC